MPAQRAPALSADDARRLEDCMAGGGVALFGADTVYGLACDPERADAVRRLYELKGRRADKPAAVMFFALDAALEALPDLHEAERAAARALLPGPVTLLLGNRARRFALACGPDPETLGLRVPRLSGAVAALGEVRRALIQSSANPSGQPEARRLCDVAAHIRAGADVVLDGGELTGVASAVVDLTGFAHGGEWRVARDGALPREQVRSLLSDALGDPPAW
jgi:L-threonylcarbamoyladenylate synthase